MSIPDLMIVNGVAVSWRSAREKRREMLEAWAWPREFHVMVAADGLAGSSAPGRFQNSRAAIAARLAAAMDADEDALTIASNAAADLVRAGKLDEAEKAANDLLVQFPEVHDGYDRLGMVHEARGDNIQAAECYRKVIALIKEHPDDYEPGFEDTFVTLVNRLDPPAET